jgi:hypothetical protein
MVTVKPPRVTELDSPLGTTVVEIDVQPASAINATAAIATPRTSRMATGLAAWRE